jgi:hypothetical protein
MKKLACRYAIVQFLPYPETGEFANVGIVLACPVTGYIGFRLESRRYRRYTHFFRDLDRSVYLRAVGALQDELQRVQKALAGVSAQTMREAFDTLVHPREAILLFSEARAVLVEDPGAAVDELFGHYVEHDFVNPEYREKALEQRVQQMLRGVHLAHLFKEERLVVHPPRFCVFRALLPVPG